MLERATSTKTKIMIVFLILIDVFTVNGALLTRKSSLDTVLFHNPVNSFFLLDGFDK